jgi:hypothetical protein
MVNSAEKGADFRESVKRQRDIWPPIAVRSAGIGWGTTFTTLNRKRKAVPMIWRMPRLCVPSVTRTMAVERTNGKPFVKLATFGMSLFGTGTDHGRSTP